MLPVVSIAISMSAFGGTLGTPTTALVLPVEPAAIVSVALGGVTVAPVVVAAASDATMTPTAMAIRRAQVGVRIGNSPPGLVSRAELLGIDGVFLFAHDANMTKT
jgi:hypothetical protein